MICCYQVTKIFSTRYGSTVASSAWAPCNFLSSVRFRNSALWGNEYEHCVLHKSSRLWSFSFSGDGELVSGVHTLVGGVVQVHHRLQVLEEEEKGRKVEQEIERENRGEENAQMTVHMEME